MPCGFPEGTGKIQVSADGAVEPVWAASGRELFYRNGDQMLAVSIASAPGFTVGKPQLLFSAPFIHSASPAYAVTRDGQHFLMVKAKETPPVRQINIVVNWFEELKRRVPTR